MQTLTLVDVLHVQTTNMTTHDNTNKECVINFAEQKGMEGTYECTCTPTLPIVAAFRDRFCSLYGVNISDGESYIIGNTKSDDIESFLIERTEKQQVAMADAIEFAKQGWIDEGKREMIAAVRECNGTVGEIWLSYRDSLIRYLEKI